ncbi:MAG: solute carrier family 26 protein [Actinomycetota bacterium]|jgi:sulfate permease, SulP family
MQGHRRRLRLPVFDWLPGYGRGDLKGDFVAGLTVGAMLIPQSMGYALLAGLPPQVGLYSAVLPLVVYAAIGWSRQLGVGPTAISSLLTSAGLAHLSGGDPALTVELAAALAVMVGLMRIALGVGRLGFMVSFLSRPVLSGFTSAAAILIAASQLKYLLGIDLEQGERVHRIVAEAAGRLDEVQGAALAVGLGGIALLAAVRRWLPSWPGALIAVAAATGAVIAFDLEDHHVSVVGDIPGRLPSIGVPTAGFDHLGDLVPTALAITMLGFVESIAIAKVFAQRHRYTIKPNRELVALGASTVAAGLSHGYPVSGSFSRTAVNAVSGARTQMAGIISAGVVALTLAVLTPLFRPLPHAVLASVVIMAVARLVDVGEARRLWTVKRSDFWLLTLAFAGTLAFGVELGLGISVVASLAVVLRQTTRPHIAVLGRIPGTTQFRNVERSPSAVTTAGVVVVRVDAPLYFANLDYLREKLATLEEEQDGRMRVLVLDATSVTELDSSADTALVEIADDLARRDIELYLAGVKGRLLDVMRRSGSYEHLGADHFFLSADDAVRHAEAVLGTGPELDIADRGEVLIEETRELHLPPPTPTRWQAK